MADEAAIKSRFEKLSGALDERTRRLWAAAEADVVGQGGQSVVARATGMERKTIRRGQKELRDGEANRSDWRIRRPGAGRKKATEKDPGLRASECFGRTA